MGSRTESRFDGSWRDAASLWAAALVLRLLWGAASRKLWGYADDGRYDDGVYLEMARGLLGRSSIPVITHPPGYPLYLALFLWPGDWGVSLARLAQYALGAALAPLSYRISLRLRFPRAAALWAGALVAVHPMLVYFNARIMSETLFALLVCAFFLIWLDAWEKGSPGRAALAGLFGGLASLTRGVMLPFGGTLALAAWLYRRRQPRWAALVAACGLAWAAVLVPWSVRNWRLYHHFVPISVQGGYNLYAGLTLDLEDIEHGRIDAMNEETRSLGITDIFAIDAHFSAKSKLWIKEHTGEFLEIAARKAVRFWKLAPEPPHGAAVRWGAGLFSALLIGAALFALWTGAAAAPGASFLVAWALHLTVLHAVYSSNLRYRLPLEPLLAVFAGAGLAELWSRMKKDKIPP